MSKLWMILTTSWKVHRHIIFQQLLWFVVAFFGIEGCVYFLQDGFCNDGSCQKENLHVGGLYVFNHMGSSSPMVGGMASYGKASFSSLLHQSSSPLS
jgi:hypothetical protein